ncbi:MAG: 3-hydroxyisobutyrate dehydrogenase [Shimia sp.]
MRIGFIGLGNMGAPMARNLIAAGHDVAGFDLVPSDLATAASAREAAAEADVVVTMLPDGPAMRAVAHDVLPGMRPGSVLLDCSTIDVATSREVAALAARRGVAALDAPVSGGIGGASAATLTFMVGGPEEAFGTCTPLFDAMGSRAVHCGPAGNGQAAKVCNNMILGATMIVTCEAFALADRLGLDRQALFDVVATSSGQSWSTTTYCPAPGIGPESPADHGYEPGFAAELMSKDLRLARIAAEEVGAATPLGTAAADLYDTFVAEDGRGRDFSAMLPWLTTRRRS